MGSVRWRKGQGAGGAGAGVPTAPAGCGRHVHRPPYMIGADITSVQAGGNSRKRDDINGTKKDIFQTPQGPRLQLHPAPNLRRSKGRGQLRPKRTATPTSRTRSRSVSASRQQASGLLSDFSLQRQLGRSRQTVRLIRVAELHDSSRSWRPPWHDYTKDAITQLNCRWARLSMVQSRQRDPAPGMLIHICDSGGLPEVDRQRENRSSIKSPAASRTGRTSAI